MEKEQNRWLKNRLVGLGIKQKDFMQKLGIQDQHFKWLEQKPKVSPKSLAIMADILKVDQNRLGLFWDNEITAQELFAGNTGTPNNYVSIKIFDVMACCGTGIEALQENIIGTWDIPLAKFRDFTTANPANAYMFQVSGDSMQPTLNSGDWAVADISQNFISSDGLYLIRTAAGLSVKRILAGLNDISIISDNTNYPNFSANVGEIQILGRIIYTLNAHKIG